MALSAVVGGVHTYDSEGHFDRARGIRLFFNTMGGHSDIDKLSLAWKMKLQNYLVGKNPPSQILDFGLWNSETLYQGLHAIAIRSADTRIQCACISPGVVQNSEALCYRRDELFGFTCLSQNVVAYVGGTKVHAKMKGTGGFWEITLQVAIRSP